MKEILKYHTENSFWSTCDLEIWNLSKLSYVWYIFTVGSGKKKRVFV